MVIPHALFKAPDNSDQKIWRYMDLTKFLLLLSSKSLYFPRTDQFEDIFEGSLPKKISTEIREKDIKQFDIRGDTLDRYLEGKRTEFKQQKEEYAISCWHINDHESAAMWSLYLKSDEGIAIQSTYSRLFQVLNESELDVFLGKVNYIDYEKDDFVRAGYEGDNVFFSYLHKRLSFKHEEELRAIFWSYRKNNKKLFPVVNGRVIMKSGLDINVNLETLIENIFASPSTPQRVVDLLQEVCNKYGFSNLTVSKSNFSINPYF